MRPTVRSPSVRCHSRAEAIKPQRDYTLTDAEREAFEEGVLRDAELHARRLCGEAPYSMLQVKPTVSAAVIRSLVCMVRRLVASKAAYRVREIETENRELRDQLQRCREAMNFWQIRYPGQGEGQPLLVPRARRGA